MSKKALIIILLFTVAIIFGGYKLISSATTGISGLKVFSNPPASVFLDDKLLGKTPYESQHPAGEYIIKLIPEESSADASTWQGKIRLLPQSYTVVKRDMGISELTSSGEIVTIEKIEGDDAEIEVSSVPDAASVLLDGAEKGLTPLTIKSVSPSEHEVAVLTTGFTGRSERVQTKSGYKLVIGFQLALARGTEVSTSSGTPDPGISTTPRSEEPSRPYVLIKDTPTGFLRVRKEASTTASEVAQLKPEQKVPFLEEKNGWFKIVYEEGKDGWISARYAQKVD